MIRHGPPRSTVAPMALWPMERCVLITDLRITADKSVCETTIFCGRDQPEISLMALLSNPAEPKYRPANTTPKPFYP
jgi:hypothetical protein